MMTDESIDPTVFEFADEAIRIMRSAVRKAQEESRRLGIPNVYSINGKLHYELPSGELTTTRPPSHAEPND